MNIFEMQIKVDNMCTDLGGLQCVRYLLKITANSEGYIKLSTVRRINRHIYWLVRFTYRENLNTN